MSITQKIIITDTNILIDLNSANILEEFVGIDNIYISDIVKNDEANSKTDNIKIINKFKVISATAVQLIEANNLNYIERKLSTYDLLNFVMARDNNGILATDDKLLKNYSEGNGVEVFRTLKIIRLMRNHNIISCKKAIDACNLLKQCPTTRIPKIDIDNLINELQKNSAMV